MIYLYRDPDGNPVELVMTCAEMMRRERADGTLLENGVTLRRDIAGEHSSKGTPASKGWPMKSDALAVLPEQVPEYMEHDRKLGVSAEYSRDGSVIFTSKAHKDKYLKAHGYHDRN